MGSVVERAKIPYLCSLYFRIFGIFRSTNIRPSYRKKKTISFDTKRRKAKFPLARYISEFLEFFVDLSNVRIVSK